MGEACSVHVAMKNTYKILIGNHEGRRLLRRNERGWKGSIKMDLREIEMEDGGWIYLAQDRDRWRALVNTRINLRVP
jgi:phage pi2 protein 07